MLNLSSRVREPEILPLHFDAELEICDEADALFMLELEYVTDRRRRALWDDAAKRIPTTRDGRKKIASEAGEVQKRTAELALKNWRMTAAGAHALQAKLDLSDVAPETEISFSKQNVDTMLDHSLLAGHITGLLDTHSLWYEAPGSPHDEDEVGNSESGPNSSTAKPPAPTASTDTD